MAMVEVVEEPSEAVALVADIVNVLAVETVNVTVPEDDA